MSHAEATYTLAPARRSRGPRPPAKTEAEFVRQRLRHGNRMKLVFVRMGEIKVFSDGTDVACRFLELPDWSLAGRYHASADEYAVLEDIRVARDEQRQLRRVMRNFDVRA